jgi:hypothetical protein
LFKNVNASLIRLGIAMRCSVLSLLIVVHTFCLWAQSSSVDKAEKDAIQSARTILVSSLDDKLPKVTLEFFLKYESEGAPIKWNVIDCGERGDRGGDSAMCVQAHLGLKDGRGVTILVSIGTFKRGQVEVPTIRDVRITNQNGTIHRLSRLADLPIELHRPFPKEPRDIPPTVSG